MKKLIIIFIIFCTFIFTISCEERRQDNNTDIIINNNETNNIIAELPIIELNDYTKEILVAIMEEDLEKLITFFDEEVKFTDDSGHFYVSTKREWDYSGFLDKQGELYALFFDTEMLNELNKGENRYGYSFFQGEAICIRDALLVSNSINLNFGRDVLIDILGQYDHNEIVLRFDEETNKIITIRYLYYPPSRR